MLFSKSDIDLLRLLRWCRYILHNDLSSCFTEMDISNLTALNLVKLHKTSGAFIITARGNALLNAIFLDLPTATPPSYQPSDMARRVRVSTIVMAAYRAGVEVFSTDIEMLTSTPALLIPAINRGRGRNPWVNTRVATIIALPDTLCAAHYVSPGIGKLLLPDELSTFSNNTSTLAQKRHALIFVGESYLEILAELETNEPGTNGRLISYGEAYRRSPLPVYLLPCDNTGVTQLQIMSRPDYRSRLTHAVLRGHYQPPPEGFDFDALFDDAPFILAVDMDLRRIDETCLKQKENGAKKPAVAALDAQAETILNARYRDTGLARVFTLTEAVLSEFLGPPSPNPGNQLFISPKGDVIHAPLIQATRKGGRPR